MNRQEEIEEAALGALKESKNLVLHHPSFMLGAQWADHHPRGFNNDPDYVERLRYGKNRLTNEEFIKILSQYPPSAIISVECCNPRALVYDEEYNLIRID